MGKMGEGGKEVQVSGYGKSHRDKRQDIENIGNDTVIGLTGDTW